MNSGTKVLLALSGLFIGVLILYYGFLSGSSDPITPTGDEVLVIDATTPEVEEPVKERPAVEMGRAIDPALGTGLARPSIAEARPPVRSESDRAELGPTPATNVAEIAWPPTPLRDTGAPAASEQTNGTAAAPPSANDPASVAANPNIREPLSTAGSGAGVARPPLAPIRRPVVQNPGAGSSGAGSSLLNPPASSAPSSAPPTRAAPAVLETYTVVSGDTLSSIAAERLGDANWWSEIARVNPGLDPDHLHVGQRILVPPKGAPARRTVQPPVAGAPARGAATTYVVESGDTLSSIANDLYGDRGEWKRLYEANRNLLDDPDALEVGMTLKVPR